MPSMLVYFVSPRRMAAIAASLMLSGVSKSGSPAAKPMTSRPAAFNSRDFCVIASVGEGLIRPRAWARKPGGRAAIGNSIGEKKRADLAMAGNRRKHAGKKKQKTNPSEINAAETPRRRKLGIVCVIPH